MPFRLSRLADRDLQGILRHSGQLFGAAQVVRYSELIARTIELAVSEPDHPRSRARTVSEFRVRSLHVEVAARRRGGASHEVFYVVEPDQGGERKLVVVRVLHEAMDFERRIAAALLEEFTPPSRPRRPRSPDR